MRELPLQHNINFTRLDTTSPQYHHINFTALYILGSKIGQAILGNGTTVHNHYYCLWKTDGGHGVYMQENLEGRKLQGRNAKMEKIY